MAAYWATADTNPEAFQGEAETAHIMNSLRKVVFSKKVKDLAWVNSVLKTEIVLEEIKKRSVARQLIEIKENKRCSILFYLLVTGGSGGACGGAAQDLEQCERYFFVTMAHFCHYLFFSYSICMIQSYC